MKVDERLQDCYSFTIVILICVCTFTGCIVFGSVAIPFDDVLAAISGGDVQKESWRYIVMETRIPAAVTSLLSGAALAIAGLLMQTTFDNPLAAHQYLVYLQVRVLVWP